MSQTNMQKAYQLLIFVMVIGLSVSRPNGSIDSQDSSENQVGVSDLEKSYPYFRPMQAFQYFNYDEPSSMDRNYQMQYRSYYPGTPFGARGSGGSMSNLPVWDPYRQLVSKRQTRYRQCYFNPISCFRK